MPRQTIPYTILCPPWHPICHAIPYTSHACQTIQYTIPYIIRPYHILCHARQAIPFPMPFPLGHTKYHVIPIRPYHIPWVPARINDIPCHASPGHAIYHTMLPGHTIYHAMHCQAMPYTMLCHARQCPIPDRSYYRAFHARQAIPYTMPCSPGYTI